MQLLYEADPFLHVIARKQSSIVTITQKNSGYYFVLMVNAPWTMNTYIDIHESSATQQQINLVIYMDAHNMYGKYMQ